MSGTDCLFRLTARLHLRRKRSPESERLRIALEMHEFGVDMYRRRMCRENPQATEGEIDAMVRAWLLGPRQGRILPPPPERRNDDDH